MKRRLSLALLFATFATATNADEVAKRVFCEQSVYPMARAAYCSIWRKKCGQPAAIETKDEIVKRLFGAQSVVSGPYWARQISSVPLMSRGDIDYLVQEAINYSGDMNSFARDAFAHCQTAWDQNEKKQLEKRLKENVTH